MEYRRLPDIEPEVSVVGMGGWSFGGDPEVWGPIDDNESIAAIQHGLDCGINLIDTAPTYGDGHSEIIIGKAISGRRDRVILATKCGLLQRNGNGDYQRNLRPESIRRECEESLRRLRVETIDLYQAHRADPNTPIAETIAEFRQLQEMGRIRAYGVCNFGCERLGQARQAGSVSTLQIELSLLERSALEEIIPYCREYGIGVLAYAPLLRGLLTGKFNPDQRFLDLRATDRRFSGQTYLHHLQRVERLSEMAAELNCSPAQLALRWVVQQSGVTAALCGIKRISQVQENAGAGDLRLPEDALDRINALVSEPL